MALIKPGPMVTAISGLLGGVIFSRNKGGAYAKSFAVPTNPNTLRQQDVRSDFASLVVAWVNDLTQLLRDGWNDFAETTPRLNALGETVFWTGQQTYISVNATLLQAALTRQDTAPPIAAAPPPDTAFAITALDSSPAQMAVAFDDTALWTAIDGAALLIYMARPRSPGVVNTKVPFRFAGAILGDAVTAPTSPVIFTTLPWTVAAGDLVFNDGRIVLPSGLQTARFRSDDFTST
ncbi:hypothetical protein LCGC14_1541780 [marine sediment metagenome]|uniref:Uncharacterized protein n=1 Tax=marine sediment metagenome TaxID=412755 RepID=A0A0F9L8V8_9ZZZZ